MIRMMSIEILNEYTGIDHREITRLFASESGYPTPKIDVRAAIFNNEGRILMVRENHDGRWALPGGWADIELSLSENLIKESMEEAGAEIRLKKIVGIFDRNRHVHDDFPYSAYKIFVECEYLRGEFSPNIEISDHGFFALDNLPELSEGRNTREQIELCFRAKDEVTFDPVYD